MISKWPYDWNKILFSLSFCYICDELITSFERRTHLFWHFMLSKVLQLAVLTYLTLKRNCYLKMNFHTLRNIYTNFLQYTIYVFAREAGNSWTFNPVPREIFMTNKHLCKKDERNSHCFINEFITYNFYINRKLKWRFITKHTVLNIKNYLVCKGNEMNH